MKQGYLLAIIVGIYAAGCGAKGNTEKKAKELILPVVNIQAKDTVLQKFYVADINAFRNVELRAKVSGFLENIYVDEGQAVKKGQLLFKLNDAEFKVQLSEAKAAHSSAMADVKSAELEYERVKTLVNKKVVTVSELELAGVRLTAAKAKLDEAQAKQEKAAIHLSYATIHAPFDGIIDRIPQKQGSLINEGALLSSVSDIHAMHVYFKVSEHEYLKYSRSGKKNNRVGEVAKLVLADGTTYRYPGKIETIEGEFEEETGSIAFRAIFPNPDKLLKHGASGKIILTSEVKSALLVPQRSIFEIQDKNYVFVVNKNNTVKMKSFEPDTRVDDFVLVKTGLADGDAILYEGVQNVKEGVTIVPRTIPADSLYAID